MKRISYILMLFAVVLTFAGCEKPEPVEAGSVIVGGIYDRSLFIGGSEGSTAVFSITAKYDWKILPSKGFVCNPSQGSAGENIAITATATQANNTADNVLIGELMFKLKATKFAGIDVWQKPQMSIESDLKVYTEANAGAAATIKFTSSTPYFTVKPSDGLEYEIVQEDEQNGKYSISVSAKGDNLSNEEVKVGEIGFAVNGVRQECLAEVFQQPAIRIDKSRVMLPGYAGAQNTFQVITPFGFGVAPASKGFSMAAADENTVVVTATGANGSDDDISLGKAEVYLASDRSCSVSVDVFQRTAVAPQTILFYFVGTSLKYHFVNNVGNAVKALDTNIQGKSRILVFIQNSTASASLYELQYDPETGVGIREKIRDYAVPAKYTQQMLTDNLADMIAFAPARSYGLIVGTHGRGWIPKASSTSTFSRNARREMQERIWTTVEGALQMRHMGDSANTQFNIDEFAAGIENIGVKMDYIILDACFMSNIESLYDMRHAADRIVASPCEVMGTGFPYKEIMRHLLLDNGTRYDLDAVCRTFVDYYDANTSASYRSACSALIDCSQIDALAQSVKRVNEAPTQDFNLDELQAYEGISSYYSPTHIFYDLEDYVRRSCADAEAVRAFSAQLDKTVSSRYHTEKFYSAYNGVLNDINYYSGVTTSAPMVLDPKSAYTDEWRQTAWYRATH